MRYALRAEKDRADAAVQTKQQQLAFLDMIAHELSKLYFDLLNAIPSH